MRAPAYSDVADELFQPTHINDPHLLYTRLRDTMPLSQIADTGVHLVANWDLIHQVLEREEDFSANLSGVLVRGEDNQPACFELQQSDATRVIATADEPHHTVHRDILHARFTPRQISKLEPLVKHWAKQYLAPIFESGGGDVIDACERIPALVVAELLGLPKQDVDDFRVWAMMGGDMLAGEVSLDQMMFLAEQTQKMSGYLGRHLDEALMNPNLTSEATLMHTLAQGVQASRINREEALGIATVLFGAGGESTAALVASCVKLLASDKELAKQLRADLSLIPRFVEEVVRLESPFKFHYRSVRQACELNGFELKKGDRLMLLWAAANRDGSVIDEPAQLKLDRKHPKQHMGFGRGVHFCIGAVLARLEAVAVIETLLCQICQNAALKLDASKTSYAQSIFVRRLDKLTLRITSVS